MMIRKILAVLTVILFGLIVFAEFFLLRKISAIYKNYLIDIIALSISVNFLLIILFFISGIELSRVIIKKLLGLPMLSFISHFLIGISISLSFTVCYCYFYNSNDILVIMAIIAIFSSISTTILYFINRYRSKNISKNDAHHEFILDAIDKEFYDCKSDF